MKKIKTYILVTMIAVFIVSSVVLTIEAVTSSAEVSQLEEVERKLLDEKRELESSLVKTLSLDQLEEKGRELGFAKPGNITYLSLDVPVAKLP